MKTVSQYIRESILHKLGLIDVKPVILNNLRLSEWSSEFEILMRNRLIMGAFRYGQLGTPHKKQYDRCEYMKRKVKEYEDTGNLECLVDVSNLAMVEFVEGCHHSRHFHSVGDHNNHAKEITL